MELVCPAGNLPSLKAAVDNGADAVYFGFRDDTNARHFPGLNFTADNAHEGVRYARSHGVRVFLAINTYPQPAGWARWQAAVDRGAEIGVDALILADIGLLAYASRRWPGLALHLSVQASASSHAALAFYHEHFGIRRAVLPRVLSVEQVQTVVEKSPTRVEVFGFGSLCIMAEGRCMLSSYCTGQSPNTCGACSPAESVRWESGPQGLDVRLGEVLVDRYAEDQPAGYPVVCKGRYHASGEPYYALEEPTSLNTLDLLPRLQAMGVAAIKIEGRQRSPAYVARVTRVWREAMDACHRSPATYRPRSDWMAALRGLSEGSQTTLGAYDRQWR
ncbi:MAG: U32 family peptidase [Gammaproteobacteria bacterium]|jgi:putative protease|nr:U32 family peptidase [Gammaproteobacteria bacterium]